MSDGDAQMVAEEIAHLQRQPGDFPKLQAEMLEAVPVELAARFLRECALRALGRFDGKPEWAVSALLQADAHREYRRRKMLAGPRGPLP